VAEVGGMLMALASELCVASVQQRIAMLMVAKSLMDAMQDWVGEMQVGSQDQNGRPCSRPERKPAERKPGRKKKPGN